MIEILTFKQRISALLKENRMTRQDLVKKLGISIASLYRYETGSRQMPMNKLVEMADILHTSVGYLSGTQEAVGHSTIALRFSARLRLLRMARAVEPESLSSLTGIPLSRYASLEEGAEPTLQELTSLADAFAVSADYLLCRTDNPHLAEPPS